MAKLNSVKNQFGSALRSAYRFGVSKKVDRETGVYKKSFIYSTNTKENLENVVSQFCDWRTKNGLPKKKICEIEAQEWQAWLRSKQLSGQISKKTAEHYRDQIVKLERIVSDWSHHRVHWADKIVIEDIRVQKIRTKKMEQSDFQTIRNCAGTNKDGAINPEIKVQVEAALDISRATGLRAREIAQLNPERIILDDDKPRIEVRDGAKGGRWRDVPIRPEWVGRMHQIKDQAIENKWEVVAKTKSEDTINKYVRYAIKAAGQGLDRKYYKTTIHAIRKSYATERMEEETSRGKSVTEAWGVVSEELGHGRLRSELEEVYVVQGKKQEE